MDDQTTGSCPTCARREPRTPQLCEVCRSRLRAWLFEVPDLYSQLSEGQPSVREYRGTRLIVDDDNVVLAEVPHFDHVSNVLPAGGGPAGFRLGPISGSKERRLPINEDAADLTGPVRSAGVAVLDEDAVGYESVASVLDFWVEDWRALRGAGERRPSATVPELARWLLDRLDDAMDHSPSVDEFFHAVRRLRGALQAQLGQQEIPDYKRGVPCPHCGALALVHHSGAAYITCGWCPAQVSFLEYDEHVRALSAEQVQARRLKVAQIKAARTLLVGLRAAGWRRGCRFEDANDRPVKTRAEGQYTILTWSRGSSRIEVSVAHGLRSPHGSIYYTPDEATDGLYASVPVDWATRYGFAALTKLARAAGILTAPASARQRGSAG